MVQEFSDLETISQLENEKEKSNFQYLFFLNHQLGTQSPQVVL